VKHLRKEQTMAKGRRWDAKRSWTWYETRVEPFGTNFLPSTACNFSELWAPETYHSDVVDAEMKLAAGTGFNSLRVFLQYLEFERDATQFLARVEDVLALASTHGLSVMPVLFNEDKDPYLGPQEKPVPGLHGSSSTGSPGPTIAEDPAKQTSLENYIRTVIGRFAQDPRVLAWDLYNEPGGSGRRGLSLPLLERAFLWAQDADPSQPLTTCAWFGDLTRTGTDQASPETDRFALEHSDIVTFHDYGDAPTLERTITELKDLGYPVVCTEWMARTRGSLIATHLPIFRRERVGSYMWGLVAGRTQTYFPWGSPAGAREPDLWFHDLYRAPDSPYNPAEIALLKEHGARLQVEAGPDTEGVGL
jgi:hypothetical protein